MSLDIPLIRRLQRAGQILFEVLHHNRMHMFFPYKSKLLRLNQPRTGLLPKWPARFQGTHCFQTT